MSPILKKRYYLPMIDWLMGYIESKGSFTISHPRIKVIKKGEFTRSISTLDEDGLIDLIPQFSEGGSIFIKKGPKTPLMVLMDVMTLCSFDPDYLKELLKLERISIEQLREILNFTIAINPPDMEEYRKFSRPCFSLGFQESDHEAIKMVKGLLEKEGIRVYGPYLMNKGRSQRIEVKGFEYCVKLHDLLARQQWYTSKRRDLDDWGREMMELLKKSRY